MQSVTRRFIPDRNTWELLGNFTARNLKLKYQASVLGFLWSLITPLMQMLIYTVVFSVIIRVKVDWPFAVFLLTAQLPWIFFSSSLMMGASSIIEHGNLIKKVSFNRSLLPIATVCSNLINFGITLVVLAGFLACYKIPVSSHIILLIPALVILALFTLGLTFITAALAVFFRDIFHILEVILLVWFWSVPVVYPIHPDHLSLLNGLPEKWEWFRSVYRLNPMVDMLEMFRYTFLYHEWPPPTMILSLFLVALLTAVAGFWIFRKVSPNFAREI
ncbi:ABC transporter permease [bacterium]|nr:ABC transporter permease [candidate division CSSED10-310 bacterium]